MTISIDLPFPLDQELAVEAEREGTSASEQATLLIHLATALTGAGRKTLFRSVVRAYLKQNALDADRLAVVCEELMALCLHDRDGSTTLSTGVSPTSTGRLNSEEVRALLREWRSPSAHVSLDHDVEISVSEPPPSESLIQSMGRMNRVSALGKYAHIGLSTEMMMREKQEEIDREDGNWMREKREEIDREDRN